MLFIYPHSRARPQTNYHCAIRECALPFCPARIFICAAQRVAFMLNLSLLFLCVPLFTLCSLTRRRWAPQYKVEFRKKPSLYSEKGCYAPQINYISAYWASGPAAHSGKLSHWEQQCHGQFLCSIDWTYPSDLIWRRFLRHRRLYFRLERNLKAPNLHCRHVFPNFLRSYFLSIQL